MAHCALWNASNTTISLPEMFDSFLLELQSPESWLASLLSSTQSLNEHCAENLTW